MSDHDIIELFWQRSEAAIDETDKKYGAYCHTIAYRILACEEDAQECVSDTYLRAWNAIPPQRPRQLPTFLAKITRNLSLDRYKHAHAQKRGEGQTALALSELEECVSGKDHVEANIEAMTVANAISAYLKRQTRQKRSIFLLRYWELCPIQEIARLHRMTQSKVSAILYRMRRELKQALEQEEIYL